MAFTMISLTDINEVTVLLRKYGFHFSKGLGQNFLVDPTVCPRMAELCGAAPETGVLEIGPGVGVLTAELAKRAGKVVAVELDERLLPVLKETLRDYKNVKIIHGDVMRLDLARLIREEFEAGTEVSVCANLPYYITSPVIMRLLEEKPGLRSVTAMVQKEAAERFCAPPGSKLAGAVSCAVHYYARPELLFEVSREGFVPRPKVDSAVMRLTVREAPPVQPKDEKLFFRCIRAAFGQRRKTLLNALSAGLALPREQAERALNAAGIAPNRRGETLTLEDFSRLSDNLAC